VEEDDELSMLAKLVLDGMEDVGVAYPYQVQSITTAEQSWARDPSQPLPQKPKRVLLPLQPSLPVEEPMSVQPYQPLGVGEVWTWT
jgi:hypothetical protein